MASALCLSLLPLGLSPSPSPSQSLIHSFTHACSAISLSSLSSLSLFMPQVLSTHCSLRQYSLPPDICRAHSLTFFRTSTSLPFSESISLIQLIKILPPISVPLPCLIFFYSTHYRLMYASICYMHLVYCLPPLEDTLHCVTATALT